MIVVVDVFVFGWLGAADDVDDDHVLKKQKCLLTSSSSVGPSSLSTLCTLDHIPFVILVHFACCVHSNHLYSLLLLSNSLFA